MDEQMEGKTLISRTRDPKRKMKLNVVCNIASSLENCSDNQKLAKKRLKV